MTINEALEAASLQALIEGVAEKVPAATSVARKAAHQKALETFDIDHLLTMQDKMKASIDQMTANTFSIDELGELSDFQLASLMRELLDQKDIKDLIETRYQMIRTAVFAHITERLANNGVEDPEFAPGEAPVSELGKKFTREGGKLKATLNHAKLAELLGTERWNKVHTTVTIPERTETKLDEDALLELVSQDFSVLEIFKACVTSGERTSQRLNIRKLEKLEWVPIS